jgi:general secretion pathway protein J
VLTRHRAATNPCSGSGSALQGCVCPGAAKTRLFIRTSRGDGIINVAPASARQRGFTLIEVLVATAQRGEQLSQRSERMRAVEGFLRRRIASALPIGFETLPDTGEQIRFIGESTRMRFVADLPDYLGRGGPHLHDVELFDDGDAGRLAVSFTMVAGAQLLPERRPRPPETLAADLSEVRFRYRGLDEENAIGEWQDEWESPGQLPLQVSIEIADADGRKWPPLVVALPQAGAGSGGLFQ